MNCITRFLSRRETGPPDFLETLQATVETVTDALAGLTDDDKALLNANLDMLLWSDLSTAIPEANNNTHSDSHTHLRTVVEALKDEKNDNAVRVLKLLRELGLHLAQ